MQPARTPRRGELSPTWRIVTAIAWIAVMLALATVWNTSVQLGLATWWLGPRGDPQPLAVQLSPFVAPVVVVVLTMNHMRWMPQIGLVASAVVAGFGAADLGRVTSLGVLQILVGAAAAAVSIASATGTYRVDAGAATAAAGTDLLPPPPS